MIRKSPYIDENYATLMSSDLNLVLTNTNNHPIAFEENSLNFLEMKKGFEEEKSGSFSNNFTHTMSTEQTPEKKENSAMRKKKTDENSLSIFNKTFNIMMEGAKTSNKFFLDAQNVEIIAQPTKCCVCGVKPLGEPPNSLLPEQFSICPICKKNMCCFCIIKCSECLRSFCKICTIVNYEQSFDRVLCLECNK